MSDFDQQLSKGGQREPFRYEPLSDALLVQCSPLFLGILPGEYASVFAAARVKVFKRGEVLHLKGDAVQHVLLVTSGFVKITQISLGGTEVILRLGAPGDVLGAAGAVSNCSHDATAQAFRSCRTLVWDIRAFKALAERFPVLHKNLIRILGRDLLELEERFQEVATERVGLRVARQLFRLREKIGRAVNGAVEIRLTREELAQMTGTTLFTVSRLLSAWEGIGLVKPSREAVTICDVHFLHSMSEGSVPEQSPRKRVVCEKLRQHRSNLRALST